MNSKIVQRALHKLLPQHTRGRKGYSKLKLLLYLMYKQCMKCTYRDLESMTGIDYSTFIKFRKRLKCRYVFETMFEHLRDSILGNLNMLKLICDSSFVETYSGHDEEGSGYSGHKEAHGYKVHQWIDFETRLPVLLCTSPGNIHDIRGCEYLLDHAPPTWNVSAFLADKGYDSESLVFDIRQKWNTVKDVAIPVRHMGGNTYNHVIKYADRSCNRELYKKRTEIERYFSRKKNVFNLGEEKTRTLSNFHTNCYLTAVMEIGEWLSKQQNTLA